ncbi:MAG: nucleotidyltransferase domain-containing protein [Thermoprotei archaeon]|nr:MAG: nucleotidyltransferase domain-containing protein [Thermoprotei archaeon]
MEILRERRKHREEVIKEAKQWALKLPFKASIILIGSYARGDFNLWSDVDVVVIAEFKGSPLERLKRLNTPPGYEIIPLTPSEFQRLLKKNNPLAIEVVSRGVILRDDYKIKNLSAFRSNKSSEVNH